MREGMRLTLYRKLEAFLACFAGEITEAISGTGSFKWQRP
jgi:hypothetical protein